MDITDRVEPDDEAETMVYRHGRSQSVRLPKDFRLPYGKATIRHVGNGVLIEPADDPVARAKAIFAEIDAMGGGQFLPEGRPEQPPIVDDDFPKFDE